MPPVPSASPFAAVPPAGGGGDAGERREGAAPDAARTEAGAGRRRGPDLSRSPGTSAGSASSPARGRTAATGAKPSAGRAVLTIGTWTSYVRRGGQDEVDACRDAVQWTGPEIGTEDGYEMRTVVIVGHDYCNGFDRFATLPVGTRVTLATVRGAWTYEVYANHVTPGRGAPAAGLYWGDLTLQSCVGPDTGFSYLVRVCREFRCQ
ncbi:hypothetical protein ACFYWD_25910 [Streptomyces sp. NPDC003781]|uniref:hypothetical protein n=1 Tax=Streptomyces sp. NPDC003781 TaxID=3364686 RepID=UPI0036D0144E